MITSSHAFRNFAALVLTSFALELVSCGDTVEEDSVPVGKLTQALTDTDSDGMDDDWETTQFGDLSATSTGDADSDGMTNGEEYLYGFVPTVNDAFADSDGDRYPNVFEVRSGSDPNSQSSIPTPTYVVNGAGGGTHTTIGAALSAANVANGAYQIIGIEPGVYSGAGNLSLTISSAKPKLLFIGLQGAAETLIDGGTTNNGWLIENSAVISSLTFRRTRQALTIESPAKEVRFVDLMVRDNTSNTVTTPGLHVISMATGGKVHVVGSTFLDNGGSPTIKQIHVAVGATTMLNTVVWSQTSGTMLAKGANATLTTNNCLVKGQTLTGTGNLAGNVDPRLRSDARLRTDSPLRGAGATVAQSRVDMDGELRPGTAPDIGVDQFNDSDSDGLPDAWELANVGSTTSMVGGADEDNDQLSNVDEYDWSANWLDPDMDSDGLMDGVEVALGSNPFVADAEDLATDLNGDGLIDSVGAQLGYQPNQPDSDGDSISNADELLMCTNPLRVDSDGDAVPEGTDPFPLDSLVSALPSDPQDVDPPEITLTAPWYAVEQ